MRSFPTHTKIYISPLVGGVAGSAVAGAGVRGDTGAMGEPVDKAAGEGDIVGDPASGALSPPREYKSKAWRPPVWGEEITTGEENTQVEKR